MIDCDRCAKSIGSEAEPICVAPNEGLLCRKCFELETGREPTPDEQQVEETGNGNK